ncbi:hypothetical protein AX15_005642 [Amanita polypyramis BW_CC]|nr:hypothetical protein AX15_005642 [Amanita polypyramis BW_CC]
MDTRPDKVDTPPAEWPLDTRQLREIHKFGAPSLWECLHEAGYRNEYELFNKLCTLAFLLYQPLSAEQVEQSTIDLGVTILEGAWVSPLTFTHEEDLVTPKGPKCVKHTHFMTSPPGAMEIDKPGPSQTLTNTQDHANQFLKRGLFLITQLHKLWTEAAETQGNTPDQLIDTLRTTFHLKEGPSNITSQVTTCANTQTSGQRGPSISPCPPPIPPDLPGLPGRKHHTLAKGKDDNVPAHPPAQENHPLDHHLEVLSKAPSLSLDEAMAVVKTMPITVTPKPNTHKSAMIQGSKESSCIISTPVLLHQGLVEHIQDLVLEDHQLAMLLSRIIAISNDRCSIILHSNQTLMEDDITAFHVLIVNTTNQPYEGCLNTNRPTYSTAKIEFLPINNAITTDTVHNTLLQIEVYNDNHTNNGVQLIPHLNNKLVQTALAPTPGTSSLGLTSQWQDNAPFVKNGAMPNRSADLDRWYALSVLSSTQPQHIITPVGDATLQMLTHNIAYTYAVLIVTALMRPPTLLAPGSQHEPTQLN